MAIGNSFLELRDVALNPQERIEPHLDSRFTKWRVRKDSAGLNLDGGGHIHHEIAALGPVLSASEGWLRQVDSSRRVEPVLKDGRARMGKPLKC
jgi:hypothetical protein